MLTAIESIQTLTDFGGEKICITYTVANTETIIHHPSIHPLSLTAYPFRYDATHLFAGIELHLQQIYKFYKSKSILSNCKTHTDAQTNLKILEHTCMF